MTACRNTIAICLWILLTLTVTGCAGDDPDWHGKDISGLMPELAFELTNSEGQVVEAEDYQGQVRLLFFGFTSCPDVCPATMAKLNKAVQSLPEGVRDQVTLLFVSVDPQRDTPEKIASYVEFFGDRTVGLTGDEPDLRKLAKRYRTTFGYDEPDDQGNYAVSHSSAVYVFDPQGRARLLMQSGQPTEQITEDLARLAASTSN